MPFQSKAQARYLFAKHPKVAKEFAAKTPSIKALPQHVKSNKEEAAESPAYEKMEMKSGAEKREPKMKVRKLFQKR